MRSITLSRCHWKSASICRGLILECCRAVWPLTLKVRDDLSTVNVALFSKEMVELLA